MRTQIFIDDLFIAQCADVHEAIAFCKRKSLITATIYFKS